MTDTAVERQAFSDFLAVLFTVIVGFLGLVIALGSLETAMAFHGLLLAVAAAIAGTVLVYRSS